MRALFLQLWRGEVPLARAFWEYAILYGLLVNLLATAGSFALFATDASTALAVAFFCLPIPYNFFVLVAVWRSAGRYTGPKQWADLARVAVVVWVLLVSVA